LNVRKAADSKTDGASSALLNLEEELGGYLERARRIALRTWAEDNQPWIKGGRISAKRATVNVNANGKVFRLGGL
jgi:hypothetical protein